MPRTATATRPARHRLVRRCAVLGAVIAVLVWLPQPASAETVNLAVNSLPQVIANLQMWLIGILAAMASLFLVLAGVLWATAGGDPGQVERAKAAFRNALIGYALAVLAPIFLHILQGIVGA